MGLGWFYCRGELSAFDVGRGKDWIPNKGKATVITSACFFEELEDIIEKSGKEKEMGTHYLGVVNDRGKTVRLEELEEANYIMAVNLIRVLKPGFREGKYDYSMYKKGMKNIMLPFEIIYRNSLPPSSSVWSRLERGEVTHKELGLPPNIKKGQRLEKPVFDISTKHEEKDRYISKDEAKKIGKISDYELRRIEDSLNIVNNLLTSTVEKIGATNEDGKIELGYDNKRRLIYIDFIGTLDECKYKYNGIHIDKEVEREFYRETDWYRDVVRAKKEADRKKIKEWKKLCKLKRPLIDPERVMLKSKIFESFANEITYQKKKIKFFECEKFEEVMKEYEDYLERWREKFP